MKREYLPYYLSRAVLSIGFSILVVGLSWRSALFMVVLFSLFILYLHSGWFSINLDTPYTPLRRDTHGMEIQRKALIFAAIAGILSYLISPYLSLWLSIDIPGSTALTAGILVYFFVQFLLFARN
jgi:hypothetical protein